MGSMISVQMENGNKYSVKNLLGYRKLGVQNTKLNKSNKISNQYLSFGLSLAPHKMSGYQVCASSTEGCRASCIVNSGHSIVFPAINQARIAKTRALFQQPKAFKEMLFSELEKMESYAQKHQRKLAIRLNVFSDLMWEKTHPDIFIKFPNITFYDYTKHYQRMLKFCRGEFPKNYHLTFSRSETNDKECLQVLKNGGNVAVVFGLTKNEWNQSRPQVWKGFKIIDGDKSDLRFLESPGVVVGLYAKGLGRKDKSGFVIRNQIMNWIRGKNE